MTRWLVPPLALAIAAAALYLLAVGGAWEEEPPLDRIDDASRQRLERVLREAEPGAPGDPRRPAGAAKP